ncbi:MAG: hypothetical protein JXB32_21755 [Deltaproteobacteria bacterium]|nr:hypothetical protein [Deltaproteobacteria bacterium]
MALGWWSCMGNGLRRRRGVGLLVLAATVAGCPPVGPEADEPLTALAPDRETGPVASTAQNAEVVAAKQRVVPYEVERGGTVYAIRDLLALVPRVGNPRERAEATFVAAAATLELVLYADLTADDRPFGGLRDAWGAADRDGVVAAVTTRLEELRATTLLAAALENALVVAGTLRAADHAVAADFARLNEVAASDGPLGYAARAVLLDLHARLLARSATEGPAALAEAAETWGSGLPDPEDQAAAGLDEPSRAVVRLLQFASANAAAVRSVSPDEPLGAILAGWLAGVTFADQPVPFVPPLAAAELPEEGDRLPLVERSGLPPGTRTFAYVTTDEVVVGLRDELRVADGTLERLPGAFGADGSARASCPLPAELPNPRRASCLQGALVAAAGAGGGTDGIALAVAATVPLAAVFDVLRTVAASGVRGVRVVGRRADGSLVGFPVELREDLDPAAQEGTVRIAQGGFYVGRRGDLVQVTRVGGVHDYAGMTRQLAGRQPPFVVAPAAGTSWSVVLETLAAVGEAAAAVDTTPTLVPPAG